jgi:hypothetical protein
VPIASQTRIKKEKKKVKGNLATAVQHLTGNLLESSSLLYNSTRASFFFFLIGIVGGGVQFGSLVTAATNMPIVPASGDYDDRESDGMIIGRGKPKYSDKTCPSASSYITNPTCCPDAKPGRRGGKPATKRLSYGTATCFFLTTVKLIAYSLSESCVFFSDRSEKVFFIILPFLYLFLDVKSILT